MTTVIKQDVRNDEVVLNPRVVYDEPQPDSLKNVKGSLLEEYLETNNPLKDYIDVYNNFVNFQIERKLKSERIRIGKNRHIEYVRVMITKPTINSSDRGNIPLYPIKCRNDGYNYMATIYVDLSLFDNEKCIESVNGVEFGKIPVMLKTILCHLYGLSPEKLLQVGECPLDPGTMFLIKGSEKLIIGQEKLKYNKILITFSTKENKKQEVACKLTNYFVRGTSVIKLTASNTGGIRVELKFMQKDSISVLQLFRLFGITEYQEMENIILLFTKYDKKKISLALVSSYNDLINVTNDVEYIEQKKGKYPEDMEYSKKLENIIHLINLELFPHMEDEPPIKKLYLISVMVCRFLEHRVGLRPMDDRDNWANKRVESPADSLKFLFNQVVRYVTDTIVNKLKPNIEKGEDINLEMVRKLMNTIKKDVTETFIGSFDTNNWGLKSNKHNKQENITDNHLRESTLSSWYQTTKITANTSRQTKQHKIRVVQMSQDGFIDIVDTPETDQCGLVKYKGLTSVISIDRDEFRVRFYVKKYISDTPLSHYCLLNGKFLGWCDGNELEKKIRYLKTNRYIPRDTSVVNNKSDGSLEIYTDGQRLTVPLLVVNQETGELVYDELKARYGEEFVKSFNNLERLGAIEYVDPAEYEYLNVSPSIKEFKSYKYLYLEAQKHKELDYFAKLIEETDNEMINYYGKRFIYGNDIARTYEEYRTRFTHVKIDPNSVFGPISSSVILSDHTQGPRNQYTCKMTRQAAGIYHSNHIFRFDTPQKMLAWTAEPIFRTKTNTMLGLKDLPFGNSVTLMFGSYTGYNQEDGIIMKKGAIERGLFTKIRFKSYKLIAKSSSDFVEEFVRPEGTEHRFRHLDEYGIARPGSRVSGDDVIIAKKRTFTALNEGKTFSFEFVTPGPGEDGTVHTVLKTTNPEGHPVVRVKVKKVKQPRVGDKFASRTAQKSTVGLILDDAYMPYDKRGITPDIIINPHSIPSRMTINKLYEMITSTYGARTGRYIDASSFDNFTIEDAKAYFRMKGMREYNDVEMYSGFTGEKMKVTMFVGICYYMSLKHLVDEKIQARARGQINPITHQPVSGRKHHGGLRLGEMEKDVTVSYGASRLGRERLFYSSDLWSTVVCRTCGNLAISHQEEGKSYNVCNLCKENAKFGLCRFPPTYKVVIQLLAGMGINVKFNTEVVQSTDISEELDKIAREVVQEEIEESIESEDYGDDN